MTKTQLACGIVFFGTLALFTFGLAYNEILMIDTRFALFVDEMLKNGIGPYPQLYGNYYPDYTSIPTMLMAMAALALGTVNQLSITLPSAIAGAAMLAMTCKIGAEFRSLRYGILAVLLSLLSFEFLNICRIASIDLYPALAATVAFFLAWRMLEGNKKILLLGILGCMVFGYLTRGPVGVMIPFAAAAAPCLAWRRFKPFAWLLAAAVLLCGILAALWLLWAYQAGGREFVDSVIEMQVASRFESGKPIWYYFTNAAGSYAVVYAVGLLAAAVYLWGFRRRRLQAPATRHEKMIQALILWMLLIICGMSLPGTKHLRYVVGAIPPAALLMGLVLENPDHKQIFRWVRKLFFILAQWFPAVILVAFALLQLLRIEAVAKLLEMNEPFHYGTLAFGAPVLALILLLNRIRFAPRTRQMVWSGGAAVTILALHIGVLEGLNQARQSSARFVAATEALRPVDKPLWFAGLGPDGDENKYLWNVPAANRFQPRYLQWERVEEEDGTPVLDENQEEIYELKYRNPAQDEISPPQSGDYLLVRIDKWENMYSDTFRAEYETIFTGRLAHRDAALLKKR